LQNTCLEVPMMNWSIICCLLVVCTVLSVKADPPRPKIQETFDAHGFLHIKEEGKDGLSGRGQWAVDQPHGKAIYHFEFFEHHEHNVHELWRYDLAKRFEIHGHQCRIHPVKPTCQHNGKGFVMQIMKETKP